MSDKKSPPEPERVLGEIMSRFGNTKIVVQERIFQGHKYVDIRKHFVDADGNWQPTRKGISVPLNVAGTLVDILARNYGEEKSDDN